MKKLGFTCVSLILKINIFGPQIWHTFLRNLHYMRGDMKPLNWINRQNLIFCFANYQIQKFQDFSLIIRWWTWIWPWSWWLECLLVIQMSTYPGRNQNIFTLFKMISDHLLISSCPVNGLWPHLMAWKYFDFHQN